MLRTRHNKEILTKFIFFILEVITLASEIVTVYIEIKVDVYPLPGRTINLRILMEVLSRFRSFQYVTQKLDWEPPWMLTTILVLGNEAKKETNTFLYFPV